MNRQAMKKHRHDMMLRPHTFFKATHCQREGCDGFVSSAELIRPTATKAVPPIAAAPAPAPRRAPPPKHPAAKAAAAPPPLCDLPKHLTLCPMLEECDDERCPYVHSEAEQQQRQEQAAAKAAADRVAAQAAAKRRAQEAEEVERRRLEEAEKARREMLAQQLQPNKKRGRRKGAGAQQQQQPQAAAGEPGAGTGMAAAAAAAVDDPLGTQLTDSATDLLKTYKRSSCISNLIDMGFDMEMAEGAAAATGYEASAATALLLQGGVPIGAQPVEVGEQAANLLRQARSLGLDRWEVESAIFTCGGDWQAAADALQVRAASGGGSDGGTSASSSRAASASAAALGASRAASAMPPAELPATGDGWSFGDQAPAYAAAALPAVAVPGAASSSGDWGGAPVTPTRAMQPLEGLAYSPIAPAEQVECPEDEFASYLTMLGIGG